MYKKNIGVAKVDSLFDPTISLIVSLSYFLAIAFGARYVLNGVLSIGELTSFTIYLGLLIWPMLAFGWLFNIVERGRASYQRVSNLLSVQEQIKEQEGAIATPPDGAIEYDIKQFSYSNHIDDFKLNDVKFTLTKGETLGIVGKTGSGKTTLLKLLLRQHDVEDGTIFFAGKSIKEYTLDALRAAIAYVPQDHFLFSATIAENIAFAKPDATMEEVIAVAKIAAIHEDITRLPKGYDTVVGERGVTLSGGQKQRISIARALLVNPEVLILDDSLSAVDAKTEEQILAALKDQRQGKTTIITTHRLSAIGHANLIIVLDKGTIIERGQHLDLLEAKGWYNKMFEKQKLETLVEQGGSTDESE